MSCIWQFAARVVTIAIVLGLCGGAYAVAPIGGAKRVDVDPTGTPIYQFGLFYVTRSPTGGFVVGWEENKKVQTPAVFEAIRYRVFDNTFAPVAVPKAADISGDKRAPGLSRLVPLGTNKAYLIYTLTRDNDNQDHPVIREAFGQIIALGTGAATGSRRLLNGPATGNWDSLIGLAAGLSDGRAVFGWYEADEVAPAPGRFIDASGVPQAVNLDFACCGSIKEAQLVRLQPLGGNFLADYLRNSVFGNSGLYARVFKSNGQPLAAAKYFAVNVASPIPKALSNGRIVVFRYLPADSPTKLVAQLYDKNWQKIGSEKTLISSGLSAGQYLDFAPTLDGGLFMLRTRETGGVWSRSVRRYDANLNKAGADYTFAATQSDGFRVEALSSTKAIVLYRNIASGGRQKLFAQIVSY